MVHAAQAPVNDDPTVPPDDVLVEKDCLKLDDKRPV